MKILITAFEAFDNNDLNFSLEVLKKLDYVSGLIKTILPVEYLGSFIKIKEEINKHKPNIIIMLGEARRYKSLGFEVIAINEYSKHPDKLNFIPPQRYIIKGGDDGLFTTLDYDLFVLSFNETNTRFHRSFSAGTYVCNSLLYFTLDYIKKEKINIQCGFIHIPDLANQDLESIILGLNNYLK